MAILQASGHVNRDGRFSTSAPKTHALYKGRVWSVPPWGLDTERLDCILRRGDAAYMRKFPNTELCTEAVPCSQHKRYASDAEREVAEDKAARKAKIAERAERRRAGLRPVPVDLETGEEIAEDAPR